MFHLVLLTLVSTALSARQVLYPGHLQDLTEQTGPRFAPGHHGTQGAEDGVGAAVGGGGGQRHHDLHFQPGVGGSQPRRHRRRNQEKDRGDRQGCGGTFTALTGEFSSPNYPSNYPDKVKCKYTFSTGYPIAITCSKFKTRGKVKKGACKGDYLTISDGGDKTTFCGKTGPNGYESATSNVKAVFKSNKKRNNKGFSCSYESITDDNNATPALLATALSLHGAGTCYSNSQSACGCSVTKDDSEFYTEVSGDYRIVVTNGIPSHVYEVGQAVANPNSACPHELYMAVPLNPVKGSTYTAYRLGPVGIAVSGGFLYNHLSNPFGGVAVVQEGESFDSCNGHSDPNCRYHYHLVPKCIAAEGSCSLVGYMLDGFAVYTYCTKDTGSGYLKSCYQDNGSGDGSDASHYTFNEEALNNGECDLDMANGYTFSDERGYAYIFTEDYPFIMAGYYGTEAATMCYLSQ